MDDAARKRRHRIERIAAALVILLLAGVAGGIFWWQRKVTAELEDSSYLPQKFEITPEMELLREYVRIDTSTPAGVAQGAQWLAAQLRKHGIEPELIESAPQRVSVYARLRGRNRGEGLMLFHHIDVVAAENTGWTAPPFAGQIVGDQMYGRGTLDMKGLAICHLLAFLEIARKGPPAHDLVFLATPDEETGSELGMKWLFANRPDVFADVKYGITEGGITEIIRQKLTYYGIEVGAKQHVEFSLVGDDLESMRQARFALEPYIFPREPERLLPEIAEFLRTIAPTRIAYRGYLANIEQTIRDGEFWRLPATYRDLLQNTVSVTSPLQTDGRWAMTVTQLNLPDERPDERIAAVGRVVAPFGVRVGEIRKIEGPVPISRWDTPLFEIIRKEAEQRYRTPAGMQILYRSATDSRVLRTHGIISYGVAPYLVDYFQSVTIHGVNERIRLPWFQQGVAFMRNVVTEWARGAK
ncbi:MAG TPA: M20/M25/M40 family metallo-hydrolase [Thermoanaerobaculia bacterium]|jgi:acetylornithine deacetylase/succinyl-diaminopimelate desuccinylase-like protein